MATAKKGSKKAPPKKRTQVELSPGPLFDALPLQPYGRPQGRQPPPPPAPPPPLDKRAATVQRKAEKEHKAEAKRHERETLKQSKTQRAAEYTAEDARLVELLKQLRGWKRRLRKVTTLEAFRTLPSISASAKHHAGSIFMFKG